MYALGLCLDEEGVDNKGEGARQEGTEMLVCAEGLNQRVKHTCRNTRIWGSGVQNLGSPDSGLPRF